MLKIPIFTSLIQTLKLDSALSSTSSCPLHVSTEYLTGMSSLTRPTPCSLPFNLLLSVSWPSHEMPASSFQLLKPPALNHPQYPKPNPSANPANSSLKAAIPHPVCYDRPSQVGCDASAEIFWELLNGFPHSHPCPCSSYSQHGSQNDPI